MAITITLVSSTIEDATTHFDLTINGDVVATVTRTLSNTNLKTLIEAAYDKGVADANLLFDPVLDDA